MFLYTAFDIIKSFDIVVLLLTAISLYIIQFYYRYFTRVNPLPGPIPFPFLDILHFLRNDFDDWVFNLYKKYGDIFEINLIGVRQIVLCRAEYIDKMLVPSMDNYMDRFPLKDVAKVLGTEGKGLTMNYDLASWKFNRQFFSKFMMTPKFNVAANKWTNELSEEMMGYWTDLGKRSVPGQDVSEEGAVVIDMATWMRRFTNDLISVLTTGKRTYTIPFHYHKLKNEKITKEMLESETFAESINNFVTESPILFVPKILQGIPIVKGKVKRFFDNLDHLYGKLEEKIRERRKEIEESVNKNQNHELRHDMLTSFITANTPYDINLQRNVDPKLLRPMTDDEIRANMLDIFLGGTDTTSNTFCFVLYYISHNPNVKKKMLEEIESVFDGDTSRPVTLEDLEKLKYCEAVIKETSRIRPTVNMFGRRNNNLPDEVAGYKWPVNTQFQIYSRAINNNPLYWEEPDKFNPDRFIDSQVTERQQKHSFMMFGGGLRVCPGRKIAIIELKALLVLMYRKFDIQLVDMNAPLNVNSKTLAVCKELKIKIRPRKKNIA